MKTHHVLFVLFVILAQAVSACAPLLTPPPPETPTSIPAQAVGSDPAEIVQAFWDAVNNQNFETALSLVADDIQVMGPQMQFSGKITFEVNLKKYYPPGTKHVVSDVVVVDDTVTYNWQVFVNDALQGSGTGESMIVKNGKITQVLIN